MNKKWTKIVKITRKMTKNLKTKKTTRKSRKKTRQKTTKNQLLVKINRLILSKNCSPREIPNKNPVKK